MTKPVFVLPFLFLTSLAAQTVETIPFRAILSSNNEVPAAAVAASGAATVLLHVVRDASGAIVSGSVDASTVSYKFPGAVSMTGMHIHNAPAGVNGAIVMPWTLPRTDDAGGVGSLAPLQTQFPSAAVTLDTINQILADPSQFYFNIHTTDAPGGAMRGQLQRAEIIVRMGIMKPENETPPIPGQTWAGTSTATTILTRDARGNPSSALVIFDLAYRGFPDDATFSGFHIHLGGAGTSGPVTINTGLRSVPVPQGGAGSLHYEVEADMTQQSVIDTLNAIAYSPADTYINAHTTVFPGGAIRSQLIPADLTQFQVTMSTANEVPPLAFAATAPAAVNVYTVRNPDGTAAAGTVVFDANPRLPAGSTPVAMHIHDQVAGQNGPVTIDSGFGNSPLLVADGTGNVYRRVVVVGGQPLASMNDVLANPEKHYVNMHTTANPGGVTRAQLTAATTAAPRVTFEETAVQDPGVITTAPGGLLLLAGTNLAKAATSLIGTNGNDTFPLMLNGSQLTVGGMQAPILSVAPDRIFAQVPFEVATGSQPVVVSTANGASTPYTVTIAAAAPAIFINGDGVVAQKISDRTFVGPGNAVKAGDMIAIFATGLGQTTPAQQTGKLTANGTTYGVSGVSARIGGQNANVVSAAAVPGAVGVYYVVAIVPAGLSSGNQPVTLQMGTITSNIAAIAVQ